MDFIQNLKTVLTLTGGKKGGIFLHGPPNAGKSLVMYIVLSLFNEDQIGVMQRCSDSDRFAFQDLLGKDIYVGEEYICNDVTADHLKMILEGNKLARAQAKNKGLKRLPRKPVLLASNWDLTIMCHRHRAALDQRLFRYEMQKQLPDQYKELYFVPEDKLSLSLRKILEI